jgi:hypothetical protein
LFKTSIGIRQDVSCNAVMDEIANNVRGENKKPGMRTLIFSDDVFI